MKARERGDYTDCCETHLACAKALAVVLHGEGGETFRTYNNEIQDNVLWLLSQEIDRATAAYYAELGSKA